MQETQPETAVDLYLRLLKRSLTDTVRPDRPDYVPLDPQGRLKGPLYRQFMRYLRTRGIDAVYREERWDVRKREEGRDWPLHADTMIGLRRLDNVEECVRTVLADGVPGDLAEAGVWRGGAAILMKAVLAAHGDTERVVWLADSFGGLPPPRPDLYPADEGDVHHEFAELAVPLEDVRANFERYGLLDDRVSFLPGWFQDTLPSAPIEQLAVLRLDADMYESTIVALRALYPKVVQGGFVIVDDYYSHPACHAAVEDYRRDAGIREEPSQVDWSACYWRVGA